MSEFDPFREAGNAMNSRGFAGFAFLRFLKGEWIADKQNIKDVAVIAIPYYTIYGWRLWQDRKPVDHRMGFIKDRFIPPHRKSLGHLDSSRWEDPNRDPWQETYCLPMIAKDGGKLYMFTTDSVGGCDAVGSLLRAYADRGTYFPGEPNSPVLRLSSTYYNHDKFGRVHTPELNIVGWEPLPKLAILRDLCPPAPADGLMAPREEALAQQPRLVSGMNDNPDNRPACASGASTSSANARQRDNRQPYESGQHYADDMDDSIPF